LFRSTAAKRAGQNGFTLIEALIALAIVATALSAIGSVIATTVRGTHAIERHLSQLAAARAVSAALPDRDRLAPGSLSGELAGQHWRLDIAPFAAPTAQRPSPWIAQTVVITVDAPTGGALQVATVRLQRRASDR
jgi:general secretion pathway protein I